MRKKKQKHFRLIVYVYQLLVLVYTSTYTILRILTKKYMIKRFSYNHGVLDELKFMIHLK